MYFSSEILVIPWADNKITSLSKTRHFAYNSRDIHLAVSGKCFISNANT